MSGAEGIALFLVACLAGAVNAVAGGGSLLTFPALVWAGRDPIIANATNTVTLWPGSLAAAIALRHDLRGAERWLALFVPPCVIGAVLGAWLLLRTPSHVFAAMVPYLILFATALFAVQGPLTARFGRPLVAAGVRGESVLPSTRFGVVLAALAFQFAVAVYGGYFGAGIGILTLAALGLIGFTDIHQMIGVRNLNAVWINGVAGLCFVAAGAVRWPDAIVMTVGQIVGGYAGAKVTRRLEPPLVRRAVVVIGIAMAASFFLRFA